MVLVECLNFRLDCTVEYKIKPPTLRVGGLILYCGYVSINGTLNVKKLLDPMWFMTICIV